MGFAFYCFFFFFCSVAVSCSFLCVAYCQSSKADRGKRNQNEKKHRE
jgi:hypothetical protein